MACTIIKERVSSMAKEICRERDESGIGLVN